MDGCTTPFESGRYFLPACTTATAKTNTVLKFRASLNYLRRVSRRYNDLAPLYALLVELVGDDELETGYTF